MRLDSHRRLAAMLHDTFGGCRELAQLGCRTARTGQQFTPAIGALAGQNAVCARRAKGALKRANPGLSGIRGKVFVAAFAAGAQLKHVVILC